MTPYVLESQVPIRAYRSTPLQLYPAPLARFIDEAEIDTIFISRDPHTMNRRFRYHCRPDPAEYDIQISKAGDTYRFSITGRIPHPPDGRSVRQLRSAYRHRFPSIVRTLDKVIKRAFTGTENPRSVTDWAISYENDPELSAAADLSKQAIARPMSEALGWLCRGPPNLSAAELDIRLNAVSAVTPLGPLRYDMAGTGPGHSWRLYSPIGARPLKP